MGKFYLPAKTIAACLPLLFLLTMCRKNTNAPEEEPPVKNIRSTPLPIVRQINDPIGGYYISLPENYSSTRESYPLLIFLHGAGQTGDGDKELHYLLNDGVGKLIKDGNFPDFFSVGGKRYSFIVAAPQYSRQPNANQVAQYIQYVRETYRIDPKRIYISGLSLGSRIATSTAAGFPDAFAAMVVMAGVAPNPGMQERCDSIASHNLPVWAFHNEDDPMVSKNNTVEFVRLINSFSPANTARLTIFDVYGHDAWTTPLSPNYKDNGQNIYEWMLGFAR